MIMNLYYQSVVTNGTVVNSSITKLSDLFQVTADEINVSTFNNQTDRDTFTLFGKYSTNKYEVTIQNVHNNTQSAYIDKLGAYHLTNVDSLNESYTFTTPQADNIYGQKVQSGISFFTNEKVLIVPEQAGRYLSKAYLRYTLNNVEHIIMLVFKFNTKTRLVELSEIWLDDVKQDISDGFRIDYVFNSIGIETCTEYNEDAQHLTVETLNKDFIFDRVPIDVNYVVLNIEALKANLEISCEYEIQEFVPIVCVSITEDGSLNLTLSMEGDKLKVSSTISEDDRAYPYGTTVAEVIEKWINLLADSSNCERKGWFEVEILYNDEGQPRMGEISNLDESAVLNTDMVICAKYITISPEDSKRIFFYAWSGDESGHYVEYSKNDDYILQTVSYDYSQGENGEDILTPNKMGCLYYDTDEERWIWSEAYTKNSTRYNVVGSGNNVAYGTLKSIPGASQMGSAYPDTQFICYVILNQALITGNYVNVNGAVKIISEDGNVLTYDYISQVTDQNVYAKITNYYIKDGKAYADVIFLGDPDSELHGATITGIDVLSTSTHIDQNLYVLQAFASLQFTIETREDNGVYLNDNFTLNGNTITIEKEYLETVTFFELSSNKVVYYSETNKDYIRAIVLAPEQFDAYLYAKSIYSLDTTALNSVLTEQSLTGNVQELKFEGNSVEISNVNNGDFVFLFYYNHSSKALIAAICDTYIKNYNGELRYYKTANNVAFTSNSVSTSVGFENGVLNDEFTRVVISTNTMFTQFVDYNGKEYKASDLKFALLTPETLMNYLSKYNDCKSREEALTFVFDDLTLITNSSDISDNAYIIAYYEDDDGNIVKVTPNYIYVNNTLHTSTMIYNQELMFIDNTAATYSDPDTQSPYSVTINVGQMITDTYDYSTNTAFGMGTPGSPSEYKLNLIAFNGAQFKALTDYVTNGFMSMKDALTLLLPSTSNYFVRTESSFTYAVLDGFEYDNTYYIIAFYTKTDANVALLTSTNIMVVSYDGTTFKSSVSTMSNNFSIAIESVNINKTTGVVSINKDYMNSIYVNYATGENLDTDFTRFLLMTEDELAMVYEYYTNGLYVSYGAASRTFKGLTLEQAFALVIYYYRPLMTGGNVDNLTRNLVTINNNIDNILTTSTLILPSYSNEYALTLYGDGILHKYYLVAVNAMASSSLFNKVSSNYVEFSMISVKESETVTTISTLDANVISINTMFINIASNENLSFKNTVTSSNLTILPDSYSLKLDTSKLSLSSNYNSVNHTLKYVFLTESQYIAIIGNNSKISLSSINNMLQNSLSYKWGNTTTSTVDFAYDTTYVAVAFWTSKADENTALAVSSNELHFKVAKTDSSISTVIV